MNWLMWSMVLGALIGLEVVIGGALWMADRRKPFDYVNGSNSPRAKLVAAALSVATIIVVLIVSWLMYGISKAMELLQ